MAPLERLLTSAVGRRDGRADRGDVRRRRDRENVRGDVAFAEASIETGGFSAGGSDNNFSGLGACDGCGGQNRFPTALDGIRVGSSC